MEELGMLAQPYDAYKQMAEKAHYRPQAPSDGFGNITVPVKYLDLDDEALEYAKQWTDDEDTAEYWIGYPSYEGRKALIYTVEAARLISGVNYALAEKLLSMALEEVRKQLKETRHEHS